MKVAEMTYFSDVLCVWAYVSQARIDAVKAKFGAAVRIDDRFCSVFGDTAGKIASVWKDRGGYHGFNAHLRQVAERFPHVQLHPDLWLTTRPASSASAHLFLKAVQLWERETGTDQDRPAGVFDQVTRNFRDAFFRDGRDIACWETQCAIAAAAERRYRCGRAAHPRRSCLRAPRGRLPGRRQDADRRQPQLRAE